MPVSRRTFLASGAVTVLGMSGCLSGPTATLEQVEGDESFISSIEFDPDGEKDSVDVIPTFPFEVSKDVRNVNFICNGEHISTHALAVGETKVELEYLGESGALQTFSVVGLTKDNNVAARAKYTVNWKKSK